MKLKLLKSLLINIALFLSLVLDSSAQLNLGSMTLSAMKAPPLTSPLDLSRGKIYKQQFLFDIGGIAFELAATPGQSLQINSLTLSYIAQNEDGGRLLLNINNQEVYTELYDWLLIPIAHYADSPDYACFTFFGHLMNKQQEDSIRAQGGEIVNYHPAFRNTLLGLRLMQCDILVMYDDCADLPKTGNNYILGEGESAPIIWQNRNGLNNIVRLLEILETELGLKFRSYLISDYQQVICFSVQNDTLQISGNPYFYCWRCREDSMSEAQQQSYKDQVISNIDQALQAAIIQPNDFNARNWYISKLLIELSRYETEFRFYSAGTVLDALQLPNDNDRGNFLNRYETASLKDLLIDLRYNMAMYEPLYLREFSERLSSDQEALRAMNPAVWDATTHTVRYAAFFRYCKAHFSEAWQNFLTQISQVSIEPSVVTPTVIWPKQQSIR